MIKRCFSFGCSFTQWHSWATWADFIGINYQEFYNFAHPGQSNKTIHNKFIEVDNLFNFCHTDLVIVGVTRFGRYNWLEEKDGKPSLFCHGAPENWPKTKNSEYIAYNLWQHKFGIHETLNMIKNVKRLLDFTRTKYYIIMAMDNRQFYDRKLFNLDNQDIDRVEEIYSLVHNRYSLEEFSINYGFMPGDNHPLPQAHYDFVEKKLPALLSPKSKELLGHFTKDLKFDEKQFEKRNSIFQQYNLHNLSVSKLYGGYH